MRGMHMISHYSPQFGEARLYVNKQFKPLKMTVTTTGDNQVFLHYGPGVISAPLGESSVLDKWKKAPKSQFLHKQDALEILNNLTVTHSNRIAQLFANRYFSSIMTSITNAPWPISSIPWWDKRKRTITF